MTWMPSTRLHPPNILDPNQSKVHIAILSYVLHCSWCHGSSPVSLVLPQPASGSEYLLFFVFLRWSHGLTLVIETSKNFSRLLWLSIHKLCWKDLSLLCVWSPRGPERVIWERRAIVNPDRAAHLLGINWQIEPREKWEKTPVKKPLSFIIWKPVVNLSEWFSKV